jgi:hypothetical protein
MTNEEPFNADCIPTTTSATDARKTRRGRGRAIG